MKTVIELKNKFVSVYAEYSAYVDILGKFILSFICLYWLSQLFGSRGPLSSLFVIVFVSLILSILPMRAIPVVSGLFLIGFTLSISIEAAAITAAVILVLFFLFLRYVPDDAIIVLLIPMAASLGISPLVPLGVGLKRGPASILAVISGSVIYCLLEILLKCESALAATAPGDYMERLTTLLSGFTDAKALYVNVAVLAAVFAVSFAVRSIDADYSFEAAIVLGAVVYAALILISNSMAGTSFGVGEAVLSSVLSAAVLLCVNYFFFSLDYKKSVRLAFEDDDYYYYVKAVPKVDRLLLRQPVNEGNSGEEKA